MRILHFSDFHLNGSQIDKAEGILGYMMDSLGTIMQAQKIDLVLFSGDMLDKGGEGFVDLMAGFEKFHEVVITPLMKCLELPESRFIFTPGNHDINRKADSERFEDNLEKDAQTLQGIINLTQASDVEMFTKRIDAFKEFENSYYSAFKDIAYTPSRFASVFEMEVDGISVGVASLNSVWRCGFGDDIHKIAMGMCPVYEYTENGRIEGLSNFFLWLCDNFGDQKRMLDAFSANMGTYSWFGVGGISNFIAQRIPCLQPLLEHKNPTVREWAKVQLESVRNEVLREQGQEAYERMTRG